MVGGSGRIVQRSLLTSSSSLPDWNPSSIKPLDSAPTENFSARERDIPVGSLHARLLAALWARRNGGETMV